MNTSCRQDLIWKTCHQFTMASLNQIVKKKQSLKEDFFWGSLSSTPACWPPSPKKRATWRNYSLTSKGEWMNWSWARCSRPMKFTLGPHLSMALSSRARSPQVSNPTLRAGFSLWRSCFMAIEALAGKAFFQLRRSSCIFHFHGCKFQGALKLDGPWEGIQITASHTDACPTLTWTNKQWLSELWKLSRLMWPKLSGLMLPSLPPYCTAGNSFCRQLLFQNFHE